MDFMKREGHGTREDNQPRVRSLGSFPPSFPGSERVSLLGGFLLGLLNGIERGHQRSRDALIGVSRVATGKTRGGDRQTPEGARKGTTSTDGLGHKGNPPLRWEKLSIALRAVTHDRARKTTRITRQGVMTTRYHANTKT